MESRAERITRLCFERLTEILIAIALLGFVCGTALYCLEFIAALFRWIFG